MTTILNELPYFDTPNHVVVNDQNVQVLPHQIIVWVSLGARKPLSPVSARFPAILDTGNTFGFSVSEKQVLGWTGLDLQTFDQLGTVLINQLPIPRYALDVLIHRNRKGQRDQFSARAPYRLELRDGIAIYPAAAAGRSPRLPLLGLRAVDENKLQSFIYGERLRVTLRTAS